jgi:hypothetical protein
LIHAAPSRRVAIRQASGGWSHACAIEQEVPRGFEPRSLDSGSRVLTVTPRDQVSVDLQEMHNLHHLRWRCPGGGPYVVRQLRDCRRPGAKAMGARAGVGTHQIGMRNAPQAGMAGICLGHGHGGNDNVLSVASQAGASLQTPESACACRCVSSGSVCPVF